MDIIQLYQDFSVDFLTEGHKHCREGWVNTPCPFCTGNPGYHLSYNLDDDFYLCWRCGWHPTSLTVSKLIHLPEHSVYPILKKYGLRILRRSKRIEKKTNTKDHRFPSNVGELSKRHKQYLESRNFDPEKIEKLWKVCSTGPVSSLDGIDYKHRILIPFIWDGVQVSFDSRDVTDKNPNKYMACPLQRELIPHKSILYGKQEEWKKTGICVEGPTDVWRLGVNSFAVSGIKITPKQIRLISNIFKRVHILFDPELQAWKQAAYLKYELRFRGCDAQIVYDIKSDPGSMKQEDADYLVKQLI